MTRPSWAEIWMGLADAIARRSLCVKAQVGAIIVNRREQVVSASYNGPPAGMGLATPCDQWCSRGSGEISRGLSYDQCSSAHAEANGFLAARGRDVTGATMYVSRAVCGSCAPMIANSGVARVIHRVGPEDAHREPERTERLFRLSGLEVVRWEP